MATQLVRCGRGQRGRPDVARLGGAGGRILLTHDVQTIPRFAYDRVRTGQPMPGVVEVDVSATIGAALEELVLLIGATCDDEWPDQVKFVPLR